MRTHTKLLRLAQRPCALQWAEMVAERHEEHKVSRIELALLARFPALGRCGVPAIAIDVLHMHRDGGESRQVTDEPVDFVAEDLRRANAHGGRSSGRVVAGSQR